MQERYLHRQPIIFLDGVVLFLFLRMISWFKRTLMFNIAARFCGYHDYDSFKEHKKEALNAFDMLDMIDENDPPIYLMNLLKGWFPKRTTLCSIM